MSQLSNLRSIRMKTSHSHGERVAAPGFCGVERIKAVRRKSCSSRLLSLAALALVIPIGAFAQDNSFATAIQNNGMWQSNLTKQMINLGATPLSSGGPPSPASCMPPVDLQRGGDGHVPPELQGDPRYQEYLRCKRGQFNPQNGHPSAGSPLLPARRHLPLAATDFVPVHGHPAVGQAIANLAVTPEQRVQLRAGAEEMFKQVATRYRGNNVAVSVSVAYVTAMETLYGSEMNPQETREFVGGVNDKLAQNPKFALMSPLEKQNDSDGLIFQSLIISMLRDMGEHDPQARHQAMELSRVVLKQLNGA
jgi:hypothetical protein